MGVQLQERGGRGAATFLLAPALSEEESRKGPAGFELAIAASVFVQQASKQASKQACMHAPARKEPQRSLCTPTHVRAPTLQQVLAVL